MVDPHADLVDGYVAAAESVGHPIVAVFETHVQADHVSGLPELVERTGATAYLPAGAGVEFEHVALADGAVVELGNTIVHGDRDAGSCPGSSRLCGGGSAPRDGGAVAGVHAATRC